MLLRRFTAYRLQRELTIANLNDLNDALKMLKRRDLGAQELACDGFEPPMPSYRPEAYALLVGHSELNWHRDFELGDDDTFGDVPAFKSGPFPFKNFGRDADALVMMFYREEKVIVSSDIKRKVNARVAELEREDNRKVYTKERGEIKDSIVRKVLPHAQSRGKVIPIIIISGGFVLIGAVGKDAEMAASAMREVLGTFPIVPLRTKHSVPQVLTTIAKAQAEDQFDRFQVTDDFQMQALEEHPAIARCKNTDITDGHIQGMMENKYVTHAAVLWDNKVSFKIDPKLAVRALRVDDAVFEEMNKDEEGEEDMSSVHYASSMIESNLVFQMVTELIHILGGEEEYVAGKDNEPLLLDGLATGLQTSRRIEQAEKAAEEEEA